MEKTSLKLVFFFSLIVTTFCLYLGDAREMTNEEVNCLDGKCLKVKIGFPPLPPLPPFPPLPPGVCKEAKDCIKYCPKQCKPGTCVCKCTGGIGSCTCTC